MTAEACGKLTPVFNFNIPQRWSIAHLYQAILSGEEHVKNITFFTTLAGYIHWKLSGALRRQCSGSGSRRQHLRKDIRQFPAKVLIRCQLVKLRQHLPVKVTYLGVNGEHAGGLAYAQHFFTGQFPMDITCQSGKKGDIFYMLLN